MPPAWKVRRGHLVFGSSVCPSVRNSVPLTNKVQYLKFLWSYSNQTWTVSSSMGSSHFTDIPCPWGGGMLVNSGPSEFGTKWIRDQVNWWIRDQVNSGPSKFGTRDWWIRDQFLVNSGPIFLSIFFTKISYFNIIFSEILQSVFICSSIIVCLKICFHIIIGSIEHLLKPNMFVLSISFHPWTAATIKINCTWSLSIVYLNK